MVIYQEIKAEGIKEGKEEGDQSLILRQLSYRVSQIPTEVQGQIAKLSLAQLEDLGEALLDFKQMKDLET